MGIGSRTESAKSALDVAAAATRASRSERKTRIVNASISTLLFFAFLALWVLLSANVSPIVFPSPRRVWDRTWEGIVSGLLFEEAWVTVQEIVAGFALGVALGFGIGVMLAHWDRARAIFNPYIVASQAVPKVALAPIFAIWFGFGITSKVFIAALIVFFPLLENTVVGLRSVNPDELTLFKSLRASTWQVFVKLRLPHAMPLIFTGLRVASVFAVIGAVVGEYIGANKGLGALVIITQGQSNTALLFGVLIMLTLMAWAFYLLVDVIGRLLLRGEQRVTYGDRQG